MPGSQTRFITRADYIEDYSQDTLSQAAQKFGISCPAEEAKIGLCWGLVGLWSFYKRQAKEKKCFFDIIRMIIQYGPRFKELSHLPPPGNAIDLARAEQIAKPLRARKEVAVQFMRNIFVQQCAIARSTNKQTFFNLGWQSYQPIFLPNLLKQTSSLSIHLRQSLTEYNLVTVNIYSQNEGHALGIIKKNNMYYFYDPNCIEGEIICSTLDEVVANTIKTAELTFEPITEISAYLHIHDLQPEPPLPALIRELIQIPFLKSCQPLLKQTYDALIQNQDSLINAYHFIQPIIKRALMLQEKPSDDLTAHLANIKLLNEQVKKILAPYLKQIEEQAAAAAPAEETIDHYKGIR